jgi:iron(III) transport system substrate-binding protein
VPSVKVENPALKALGSFQTEKVSVAVIGKNQIAAQKLLDQAGYK